MLSPRRHSPWQLFMLSVLILIAQSAIIVHSSVHEFHKHDEHSLSFELPEHQQASDLEQVARFTQWTERTHSGVHQSHEQDEACFGFEMLEHQQGNGLEQVAQLAMFVPAGINGATPFSGLQLRTNKQHYFARAPPVFLI